MKQVFKIVMVLMLLLFLAACSPVVEEPLVRLGELTQESLAVVAGGVLSVIFSFVPGLNVWFAAKPENLKRILMAFYLAVLVGALFGGMCLGIFYITGAVCDQITAIQFIYLWMLAAVSNQSIYSLTPRLQRVEAAKID